MADYKILENGVTETTRLNEQGKFVPVRIVRYMVGTHGPFMLAIDAKEFSTDEVNKRIMADVAHIKGLEALGA